MSSGIHEFVLRGGQKITGGDMVAIQQKLPLLKVKAETLEAPEFPQLPIQISFLVRYMEDVLDGVYNCNDLATVPEAVFALDYLMRDVDIIPDSVPGKGYADDAAVIRAVIDSHREEFEIYSKKFGIDYTSITSGS